jgi:uncharacterized protein (TIGR02266 family)
MLGHSRDRREESCCLQASRKTAMVDDLDGENRRGSDRSLIEAEVSVASDSQFFTGIAGNVSTGGLFVATYRALPVGGRVAMQIALPEGDVLATGTVRWIRDASSGASPGLGIAFDGAIGDDDIERIERFCAVRQPLLHDDE